MLLKESEMVTSPQQNVSPSLNVGRRVRYTEDGILSMIYGVVAGWQFNQASDRIEYQVKWDRESDADESLYPRCHLHPC
jgi:hypothetical protein